MFATLSVEGCSEPYLDHLADRALFDPASPVSAPDERGDAESLEWTAAAALLALAPANPEPLPAELQQRIARQADRFLASAPIQTQAEPLAPRTRHFAKLGWLVAAASLLWVAWISWKPAARPVAESLADRVERLRPEYRAVALAATDHPLAKGSAGEVLWNAERQEGFIRVSGLTEVDPREGIYQLWIFDGTRDARYPIDGGTFAVGGATESIVVPIRAALPVRNPTLFAVTLEPPGGGVVSDRRRIMLASSGQ